VRIVNGGHEPFARLPDCVELELSEVAVVLGALDEAAELAAPGTEAHRSIRVATKLLTGKVWPELGDLLDRDEE
jgi:hypothetical protein